MGSQRKGLKMTKKSPFCSMGYKRYKMTHPRNKNTDIDSPAVSEHSYVVGGAFTRGFSPRTYLN